MTNKKNKKHRQTNPWTPKDEGDHYRSMKEWWAIETLFKTLKDNRKWNLKACLAYELETPSCFYVYHLFDTNNKIVAQKAINDDIKKLSYTKNKVDLKYENNSIKGQYPDYKIHIEDDKQNFLTDMNYKANILPHWSAQDVTNGYLPIGLDHYRYGWLLNCNLTGNIKIDDEILKIKGKGYLEHAWGNWSYKNPFQKLSGLRKTISIYCKLINWRLSNFTPNIPDRIAFTSENNPLGYDWFWGIFDNDWSIFYGNSLLWISEGPAMGVLTLFTEGNNYLDFGDVQFRYNKVIYLKKYDIYYPSDLTIKAKIDDKKLNLRIWPTCKSHEYIFKYKGNGFYRAITIPELPGKMKGVYSDNEKTVQLEGDCKIVQQRVASKLGHNSLTIDFIKPPNGVGISFDLDSHYLNKKIISKIQFAPKPRFKLNIKKI
ncbi:MAG: hypothetical protein AYK22_05345 [Thermoplasmatales archaeon SG8-52-3]|nr:MAG: hypothetical protein AYK22_05345 [Thermoplasmatales archaeon SG8-52-3]